MKILYLHTEVGGELNSFGVETHVKSMVSALRQLGHYVDIKFPGNTHSRKSLRLAYVTILKKIAPNFVCNYMRELFLRLHDIRSYRRLAKYLKQRPVDILYERHSGTSSVGLRLAKAFHIPRIVDIIGPIDQNIRYYNYPRKGYYVLRQIRSLQSADGITTSSSYMKRHLIDIGIEKNKIFVIPNGVDLKMFDPRCRTDNLREQLNLMNKFILGYSGSFSPWNGVEILLRVGLSLKKLIPNFHLLIVGDGKSRKQLQRYCDLNSLRRNVTFVGSVPHSEMPKYINLMDIAVIPNSNPAGSPAKLFEYMAMRKPVAAPILPPLTDVLRNRSDSILFKPENEDQLARAIFTLYSDPSLMKKISARARDKAVHNFSWDLLAKRLETIFVQVMR
ncbi:MAG: glycosyltransferase family 4 protein [Candidatus Hodarchaeota archaeon]